MRTNVYPVCLWLLSSPVWADMGSPGHTRVPKEVIFEVKHDFSDYVLYLRSARGFEPIEPAPGKPTHFDGTGRVASDRIAYVIAVPRATLALKSAKEEWIKVLEADPFKAPPLPSWVRRSEMIDFRAEVPFYDSRTRVVERYLLEVGSLNRLELVKVGENEGSPWVKRAWIAGGILLTSAILCLRGAVIRFTKHLGRHLLQSPSDEVDRDCLT